MAVLGLGVCDSILVRFRSLECVGFTLTNLKTHEIVPMESIFPMGRLFHHFAELSTPWISFLWGDLQFSHQFCVVTSIHSEFVVALFMILQWVYYPSFSTNIIINVASMYFQKVYRFEVDMLKKFSMSFPLLKNIRNNEQYLY